MCELQRFKGHLHFIKDTTIGYNIHLKDRYSAVRLISNCMKLRTSQTINKQPDLARSGGITRLQNVH